MSEEEQIRADMAIVETHINQLAEHFDSIQVFVTRCIGEQDKTRHISRGSGNWFTRYGQVREWQLRQDEAARIVAHEDEDEE